MNAFANGRQFLTQQRQQQALRRDALEPVPCVAIFSKQPSGQIKLEGVALTAPGAVELLAMLRVQSQTSEAEQPEPEYYRIETTLLPR